MIAFGNRRVFSGHIFEKPHSMCDPMWSAMKTAPNFSMYTR